MKDMADQRMGPLRAVPGPAMPVARLLIGQPVTEVAVLMPRLFNLCRAAQDIAVTRALDLPATGADLAAEIRRDHMMKLFVTWPGQFGASPRLTPDLLSDEKAAISALFGNAGRPRTGAAMTDFLGSGHGIAPLLRRIAGCFTLGEAVADGVDLPSEDTVFRAVALENSPAGRRAADPALAGVEATHGRGPLWRALGRAVDLAAILEHDLPPVRRPGPGRVVVPATRGDYAVAARAENGIVTAFHRVTPTDHLLAQGGVLDRTLASLGADHAGLAPLLLDILDPCSPVRLEAVNHA